MAENPYYLMLQLDELPDTSSGLDGPVTTERILKIDLDEHGWLKTYDEELFHRTGNWHLVRKKEDGIVFSVRVWEGDQPYYTSRVIGVVGLGEARAYSIGKKTKRFRKKKQKWVDNEDNLWVLPWGQICGGTDVEYFATQGMKKGLHRLHEV